MFLEGGRKGKGGRKVEEEKRKRKDGRKRGRGGMDKENDMIQDVNV